MRANITFEQLYWNDNLMRFFMRQQARNTLEELLDRAKDRYDAVKQLGSYFNDDYYSIDTFEEIFYQEEVEKISEDYNIDLKN